MKRVEWTEVGQYESFHVIADLADMGWEFAEKSIWDVRYYPVKSTPELIVKAEEALARMQEHHTPFDANAIAKTLIEFAQVE